MAAVASPTISIRFATAAETYPAIVVSNAAHLFEELQTKPDTWVRKNSFQERFFSIKPKEGLSTERLSEISTDVFGLFIKIMAEYNPNFLRQMGEKIRDIGTDHICIQLHAKDLQSFLKFDFKTPLDRLKEVIRPA